MFKETVKRKLKEVFRTRTLKDVYFDLKRLKTRLRNHSHKKIKPDSEKLHFGCGSVLVEGWLNVDISGSDYDVDLGCGSLPWECNSFEVIASQQTVEHLELHEELIPLLKELKRVSKPGSKIWLACPDMERICKSYLEYEGSDLVKDRKKRWPNFDLKEDVPSQHMINIYFHQSGQHRNIFDFELISYALRKGGFSECTQVDEDKFNRRFENFPEREDDYSSLYVKAMSC